MRADHEERILNACLEEVLGGKYPPDLSAKILQTWESRRASGNAAGGSAADGSSADGAVPSATGLAPPLAEPVAPPVQLLAVPAFTRSGSPLPRPTPISTTSRSRFHRNREKSQWWSMAAAASAVAACLSLAFLVIGVQQPDLIRGWLGRDVAEDVAERPNRNRSTDRRQQNERAVANSPSSARPRNGNSNEQNLASDSPAGVSGRSDRTSIDLPSPFAQGNGATTVANSGRTKPTAVASPDADVIRFVNEAIQLTWREHQVQPTPPAGDEEWCERVYRKLVGRSPSAEESSMFMADARPDRRAQLVDSLLASEDYSRHWAAVWANILLDGRNSPANDSSVSRDGLEKFLQDSLAAGRSHAEIATALLTARGSNSPSDSDFNGAVNFLASGAGNYAIPATTVTSRVFLGKQLQCAQCHDRASNGLAQADFWGLNAFFRQMKTVPVAEGGGLRIADQDFFGESGAGTDAEIFYELADGRMKMAYPKFAGAEQSHSGLVSEFDRRQKLAELIVASEDFPRATVNRVWAALFGFGFTTPVDDMGPHNPASHPALLARLSDEFSAHDFDTRRLARWLVLSDAFGLSAVPVSPLKDPRLDSPEFGGRPLFARFYERPAELPEAQRSLLIAANRRQPSLATMSSVLANRSFPEPGRSGNSNGNSNTSSNAAVAPPSPMSLPAVTALPEIDNGWLRELAASSLNPQQKIEHLFSAALGRRPTDRELIAAKLVLANQRDSRQGVIEVWRALLNCRESLNE